LILNCVAYTCFGALAALCMATIAAMWTAQSERFAAAQELRREAMKQRADAVAEAQLNREPDRLNEMLLIAARATHLMPLPEVSGHVSTCPELPQFPNEWWLKSPEPWTGVAPEETTKGRR